MFHTHGSFSRLLAAAILSLAALVATFASTAAAQNVTGTISGTIIDEQRQVVPGATIDVINERTGDTRAGVSAGDGRFEITNVGF